MISVVTNYLAMNAGRQFNIVSKDKNKSVEKLSSGYKINRAADDAAGLSISEKMRHQIRNLNQACDNIQDGISLVHTADGVFEEITSITKRINELCVQAANDTNDEDDRAAIDAEIQELKEEISDTLFNASFNTKRLFSEPYLPEVWGQPRTEDIQVYNDGLGGYGGISINNIRYTWQELGVTFKADGTYSSDILFPPLGHRDSVRDPVTNETINLCFRAGERPPMASREYHWEATDDGIYVNKVFATSWEGLKGGFNKANPRGGIYSFDYRGMTIRFSTNEGDDFETVKNGINSNLDSFQTEVFWNASAIYSYDQHSVDIYDPTKSVRIHQKENDGGIYRWDYVDTEYFYELRATADGVQLVDIPNHVDSPKSEKHSIIPWDHFRNTTGDLPVGVPDNGGYPIVDWGKSDKPNTQNFITLDNHAIYEYTDAYTGISFKFKLSDEISFEQIQNGMTLSLGTIKTKLTARTDTKSYSIVPPENANNHEIIPSLNNLTYEFMLRAERDFDDESYVFPTSTLFKKTSSSEYTYTYDFQNGLYMSGTVSTAVVDKNLRDLEFNDTSLFIDLKCNKYGNSNGSDGSICYKVESVNSVYDKALLSVAANNSELARVGMDNYLHSMSNGNALSDIDNARYKVSTAIYNLSRKIDQDNNAEPSDKMPADELAKLNTQLDNFKKIGQNLTDIMNIYNHMNAAADISNMYNANIIYDKILIKDGKFTDTDKSLSSPDTAYTAFVNSRTNAFSSLTTTASTICTLLQNCEDLAGTDYEYKDLIGSVRNLHNTYSNISNYNDTIQASEREQMRYCQVLKDYKKSYIDTLSNSNLTTYCKGFAVTEISNLDDKYTPSVHTVFDATIDDVMPRKKCYIQSGANEDEDTLMEWDCLNLTRIGLGGANSLTREQAVASIARANRALSVINHNRSLFGAYENRLSSQYDNNRNYSENLDQAESKLRDTDMAEEAANYAKHTIIQNAGQAMLSQANQKMSMVINLLQQ